MHDLLVHEFQKHSDFPILSQKHSVFPIPLESFESKPRCFDTTSILQDLAPHVTM